MSDQDPPPPPPPSGGFPPPPPPPPPPTGGAFGTPPPGSAFGTPPPAGYAPYSAAPPTGAGISAPLAGFGPRFGGWLIDVIVMGLFGLPAWLVLVTGPKHLTECTVDSSGNITGFGEEANAFCKTPTGATVGLVILLGLLGIAAAFVYQAKLAGGPSGQTLGMKAVGVRVIDANTGGPIGGGRAIGRYVVSFFSAVLCYLGYLWNLWDPKKQTWQDKATTAIVIKT